MSDLILYNKFDSLNEYLKHQQYKYIYQHPLFIKNGNKKTLSSGGAAPSDKVYIFCEK